MRLITWMFANMLGKNRYEVATVEKNIEINESSLKLRDIIPIRSATARKKRITGINGSTITRDAFSHRVRRQDMATIPTR